MQLIDFDSAKQLIRVMVPEWAWLLKHIESEDGYVCFPQLFSQIIANLKIEKYPQLYEKEASIGAIMLQAFMEPEEIKELDAKLSLMSPQDRGKFMNDAVKDLREIGDGIEIPKTPGQQKRAEKAFTALSEEDKKRATRFWQYFMMAFLASFYQSLSVMVHGEKLTSLVTQAKVGDDKAFAKAVQIDKRILFEIPYFANRYKNAQTEGNWKFTEYVGEHLTRPPYKGKIRHKLLYLAFAILDMAGLLKTRHRVLLNLCDEAGIDRHASRIDDLKNFSKRLSEYRAFQRRSITVSTP